MKPTVDLTEDRMFPDTHASRGPSWLVGNSDKTRVPLITFSFRMPWESDMLTSINVDDVFINWRFQLSGSAKEYRQREEWRRADSIDYCDRCGKRIRTPWRWDRTLCDDCSIQLYNDVHKGKVPWEDDNSSLRTLS